MDKCQHNCPYCLPNKNIKSNTILKLEEYKKIAKLLSSLKILKIRFTGGEPLMNKEFKNIVNIFNFYFPSAELAITTNAQNLIKKIDTILKVNIKKINIHIDTLNSLKYKKYCSGDLSNIFKCINILKKKNVFIKINIVIQKFFNVDEILDFLNFSKEFNIEIRFIELINTGISNNYINNSFFSSEDILKIISSFYKIYYFGRKNIFDSSVSYFCQNLNIFFGVISSSSLPFCLNCNRIRISYDGYLKNCLYEKFGLNLFNLIKNSNFLEIKDKINNYLNKKKDFNPKNLNIYEIRNDIFSMSEIGG